MANPLPEEKEFYERISREGITINEDAWDFIYHRVNENITAIMLICQHWLKNQEAMPIIEAGKILVRTKEIKNTISSITSSSKDSLAFPQFQDEIPLNPIVRELITHQFGNDIYIIELILQDTIDTVNPTPVSAENIQRVLNHAQAIKDFIERLRDTAQWRVSGEKYHTLYDSFKGGLILTDMLGNILDANQAFSDMLGYTKEEIKKLTHQQLTPEQWRKNEEDIVRELIIKRGYSDEYEKEYIRKDGRAFPVVLSVWLIRNKQGEPLGMWGIVWDITERRKKDKENLDELLDSYAVINKISDGITVSDTRGNFEVFNAGMKEITGYTVDEANRVGGDFNVFIHPESKDRQDILKSLSEIAKGKEYHETETAIRVKDGSEKMLLVSTSLINYKNQDMFLSVWRDITESKRLHNALHDSETRFRRLFEAAQDGILILDAETGQITEVNKFLMDMLGYLHEEFLGKKLWEVGAFIDIEKSKTAFQRLQTEGYARYEDLPLKTKDGRLINVEFVSNVYYVDHTKVIQCNIRNITERKHLETEREEWNKKLEQLALKDSHTGLYNHHYLKDALAINFSLAERNFSPLSLIMMDIDYFKSINDVYGHVFGDLVLKQFAMLLTNTVRPYDVAIRYGGEEFIIISPDTGKSGVLILADRILDKTQMHNFGDKTHSIKLKLSLGVVSYPEDNVLNGMELVDLADQILNKAKENGGNRICSSLDIKTEAGKTSEPSDILSLKDKISKLTLRANQSLIEETFAFAKTIELKDHYTSEHSERTVRYAVGISHKLNLPQETTKLIEQAAMLHDLGKVGISEEILHKKSKLSRLEFEEIRKHPQIGVDILRPIHSLHPIIPALLYHHERWDGKGYPYGFKKERIPLVARIIAIADVYEALVSDRPYRKAYSKEKAISIVKKASGTQFDPDIVDSFLKVLQDEK